MKRSNTENDTITKTTSDQSIDLLSIVFQKTVFLSEQARDREAIRSWLDGHDIDK